jgi:uncharacterized protein YcbK (DUF882 family)
MAFRCPERLRAVAFAAALAATLLPFAGAAAAETRTLSFVHTHTGETATITFKRNGVYDPEGLRQANWFLRDWRRNIPTEMNPRLLDLVWQVHRDVGATQPVHLVSGFRSPATNAMLRSRSSGVARESQHTRGNAMDFFIPGVPVARLREHAIIKEQGGVGFYPGSNFVHLDVGRVRAWPRLSRDHLARLFPGGETLHLPADGRPLPGHATALARLRRDAGGETLTAFAGDAARRDAARTEASPDPTGRSIIDMMFGEGERPPPRRPRAPRSMVADAPAATPAPERRVVPTPVPRARPEVDDDGDDDAVPLPLPRPAQVAALGSMPTAVPAPAPLPRMIVRLEPWRERPALVAGILGRIDGVAYAAPAADASAFRAEPMGTGELRAVRTPARFGLLRAP